MLQFMMGILNRSVKIINCTLRFCVMCLMINKNILQKKSCQFFLIKQSVFGIKENTRGTYLASLTVPSAALPSLDSIAKFYKLETCCNYFPFGK